MFFRFLTYNKFKEKKWLKLSTYQRAAVFQKLENIQSKKLHRPVCKIVFMQMKDNLNGFYVNEEQAIYLNSQFIMEPNLRFIGMATLFHEGRHAFQHYVCFEKKHKPLFLGSRKWIKNFQGYSNAEEDKYSFYSMQPVERDANKYALKRMRQFRRRFKDLRVYEATIEYLQHEFDEVKSHAKKELGIFYNLKVAKNTNKKRKDNGY